MSVAQQEAVPDGEKCSWSLLLVWRVRFCRCAAQFTLTASGNPANLAQKGTQRRVLVIPAHRPSVGYTGRTRVSLSTDPTVPVGDGKRYTSLHLFAAGEGVPAGDILGLKVHMRYPIVAGYPRGGLNKLSLDSLGLEGRLAVGVKHWRWVEVLLT